MVEVAHCVAVTQVRWVLLCQLFEFVFGQWGADVLTTLLWLPVHLLDHHLGSMVLPIIPQNVVLKLLFLVKVGLHEDLVFSEHPKLAREGLQELAFEVLCMILLPSLLN